MISTRGRYAIRVMIDLAENGRDGFIPLKEIAERQGISKKFLEILVRVLGQLVIVLLTVFLVVLFLCGHSAFSGFLSGGEVSVDLLRDQSEDEVLLCHLVAVQIVLDLHK